MQRRAAAIYAVFFLVVGAASYSLIATAESPTIAFENPEHRLQQGDTFSVGNQDYTVTSLEVTEPSGGGGAHGGGGGPSYSAEVAWTVENSEYQQAWENDSTVTYQNESYTVVIPNTNDDPSQFVLRENINRSAILMDDPQADNETVTRNGEDYVVITENGTSSLVAAEEYFPAPNERQFEEGQQIPYEDYTATVDTVTNQSATLVWTAPREQTASMSQENNVTLSGTTFLAYFPNDNTVVLTSDFQSYDRQTAEISQFHEQKNGLWGVSIVSGIVIVLLVGMAYLPSRY